MISRAAWMVRTVLCVACVSIAARASAHFPWLAIDDQGRALLFFGESLEDRTYHLPESIAKTKVAVRSADGKTAEPALESIEEDEYIGLRSKEPVAKGAVLEASCQYGIYHGMLLSYYSKHLPGGATEWEKNGTAQSLKLDTTPRLTKDGFELVVTWDGKPVEGASVSLWDGSDDGQEGKTDASGVAAFKTVRPGPVGAIVNHNRPEKGTFDGEEYVKEAHYGTLSFEIGEGAKPKAEKAASTREDAAGQQAGAMAPLPEPVASFGAAVADGWLYVYGGHTGGEHEHSKENLSQHFRRLELAENGTWEDLPMQTPLQGLPLVAYKGKLYRVGGLSATNAADEDENINSVTEFAVFDPATKSWTALPSLPEARSSHDAAVVGDKLCVVGGWTLTGDREGEWLDTAWEFDLSKPEGSWTELPKPTFRRRALAVAEWRGKLVALGGMNEKAKVAKEVHMLDLKTGAWSKLSDLPGAGQMDGFGVSAWNLGGDLYASGTQEAVYRLGADGLKWVTAAEMVQPRFFHRLVARDGSTLLAVAGASMRGHLANIEVLKPAAN